MMSIKVKARSNDGQICENNFNYISSTCETPAVNYKSSIIILSSTDWPNINDLCHKTILKVNWRSNIQNWLNIHCFKMQTYYFVMQRLNKRSKDKRLAKNQRPWLFQGHNLCILSGGQEQRIGRNWIMYSLKCLIQVSPLHSHYSEYLNKVKGDLLYSLLLFGCLIKVSSLAPHHSEYLITVSLLTSH